MLSVKSLKSIEKTCFFLQMLSKCYRNVIEMLSVSLWLFFQKSKENSSLGEESAEKMNIGL